jgi:hypothetical protein
MPQTVMECLTQLIMSKIMLPNSITMHLLLSSIANPLHTVHTILRIVLQLPALKQPLLIVLPQRHVTQLQRLVLQLVTVRKQPNLHVLQPLIVQKRPNLHVLQLVTVRKRPSLHALQLLIALPSPLAQPQLPVQQSLLAQPQLPVQPSLHAQPQLPVQLNLLVLPQPLVRPNLLAQPQLLVQPNLHVPQLLTVQPSLLAQPHRPVIQPQRLVIQLQLLAQLLRIVIQRHVKDHITLNIIYQQSATHSIMSNIRLELGECGR